ncbi:hypothetical protein SAMN05444392_11917 [Seinonella peptonophila]|uniref:Uncharacterized protein n=1 Tax=Seinonella peptonophila TaxID=112248 RepID=A0A1M5B7H6_9BACL|nr:hypothetical protein SAMN05444392_11917 [Seinonella peptonophila]
MIILGLDLSLSSPGYAVIEANKKGYKLFEVGHIKGKTKTFSESKAQANPNSRQHS